MEKKFAVKHSFEVMGPLVNLYKQVKKKPFSFTSKKHMAEEAAKGNFVYVIEVRREHGVTKYYLGYKYRATDILRPTKGSLWQDKFKFKNTVKYGQMSDGIYFENPKLISDVDFIEWFKGETLGMSEIPHELAEVLDIQFNSEGCSKFKS
ncbi:hypothetical protein [Ferrimonas balearica]|uniref:hypothetical protein n=1 Tax=Ferrimonas balearica TaxID=44012 RepID=UPI001F36956B|nr:hypothetical protein [Ferrimonas balearica]MBY6094935.1 hypothetical protein [Ferrimonas balearica]